MIRISSRLLISARLLVRRHLSGFKKISWRKLRPIIQNRSWLKQIRQEAGSIPLISFLIDIFLIYFFLIYFYFISLPHISPRKGRSFSVFPSLFSAQPSSTASGTGRPHRFPGKRQGMLPAIAHRPDCWESHPSN